MSTVHLKVNGKSHQVSVDPGTPLLYVLRDDLGLTGLHFGCGLSECGACTVHLGGKAIRSCVTPVKEAEGKAVTTLRGLGTPAHPHPLQTAFIKHQAAQCGYCISGMIMEAAAYLPDHQKASRAEIKKALSGHLCRCGTHYRILSAVEEVSQA